MALSLCLFTCQLRLYPQLTSHDLKFVEKSKLFRVIGVGEGDQPNFLNVLLMSVSLTACIMQGHMILHVHNFLQKSEYA